MKPACYLVTIWLAAATFTSFAQSDSTFLNRAVNSLKTNSEKNPVEKAYLQLDKAYYAAGDDIWFKAYVTVGSKHQLSGISGILNVELINYKGLIEQAVKLPLVSGLTWGDFKLADTIHAGNYRIRAYTNWMRNAGNDYFYDRTISIGNAIFHSAAANNDHRHKQVKGSQQAVNAKPMSGKINVQFFPESGNLVYGISSKVAFKAVGEDGLGKDIKGVIVDEQNQEITRFSSQHLGMGVFNLLPASGKTYKARITYADGSEKGMDLPTPLISGYVLHIDNTDPLYIEVKIDASADMIRENATGGVNLIAQAGGEVYYAAKSKSVCSSFSSVVPKSKFPSGIVQFTLFSGDGEPLNERLVFIQNPDQVNLAVSASEKTFIPRGKMKIELAAKGDQGKPALGNFSVAIIDESKAPIDEMDESTIFSNLLLTSDIRGYIQKPNYYFACVGAQGKEDLDVLMLTQGYHRFAWKQILTNNFMPVVYKPESSLEITGHLKTLRGKPVPQGKVSLLSSFHGFFMVDTVTDANGYFAFENMQFNDSVKFVIQSRKTKSTKNVEIELDSITSPAVTFNRKLPNLYASADTGFAAYLANSKKIYNEQVRYGIGDHTRILKEVEIAAKKPLLENSSNLNGPGNADQVLLAKAINTGCPTIANCLMGKLTAVFFKYDMDKMVYFPCIYQSGKAVPMKIKVDGMSVDAETLNTLPPEIVESVEVLRFSSKTAIYGFEGYNGLILINTKKGNYTEAASIGNIIAFSPKGYYKAREFYSPQYDDPKTNTQMADLRTTIYWNPNIATGKDGIATFEYFNADTKGAYRIVVEGIDEKGNLARQLYRYKVE
jgi:hypothetical protein